MPDGARRIVLINDFSVARGGATKLSLDLAQGLRARGREVVYFAGDNGENRRFSEWGVDVVAVGGRRLLDSKREGFVNGIYCQASARALRRLILSSDRPDTVYHVHSWAQILSPSIFAALKPVAERVFITAHDFFLVCPNGNFMIYPRSRQCDLRPMSASCIATNCDKRNYLQKTWRVARQAALNSIMEIGKFPFTVIAIQKGAVEYLVRGGIPEERLRVLSNPAVRLLTDRAPAEKNAEALYVGRLEHEKGVELLAAAALASGTPLRVIGEGPAEGSIRKANPEAMFTGWLSPGELAVALKSARFLVMPSRCTEPFGLAGAEALAVGVPVIASKSCLIGGDIRRLEIGDVVDVFNADSFAAMLTRWRSDDALIERMSRAAIRKASAIGASPDEWLDAHLRLYDGLFQSAPVKAARLARA